MGLSGQDAAEFIKTRQMLNKGYIKFEGLHHLADHNGGFVIGAHLGNWEALSMLGPCINLKTGLIYRPLKKPDVSRLMKLRTYAANADIYEKGRQAAMGMMSTLRNGGFMLLLVDQQLREGETVPFFGYPPRPLWPYQTRRENRQAYFYGADRPWAGCNIKVLFLHRFICSKQLMTKTAERSQNRSISRLKHG